MKKTAILRFEHLIFLLLLFSVLLLTSIIITGCDGGGTPKSVNYRTGTEGLVIEFKTNNPPETVGEEDSFAVLLGMQNKGAFDLTYDNKEYGTVFYNYDPFYLEEEPTISSWAYDGEILLAGKSNSYPNGESTFVELTRFKVKKLEEQLETSKTQIFVNACYPYETFLSEEVCIDTNIYGENLRNQVCQKKNLDLSSQGAPIAITSVEVDMLPVQGKIRPSFKIIINNKGRGTVLSPVKTSEISQACNSFSKESFNKVSIRAALSNLSLECKPEIVRLVDDEGYAYCYVKDENLLGRVDNYNAILNVKLNYLYSQSISQDITIKRRPSFDINFSAYTCLDKTNGENCDYNDPNNVCYESKCISKCNYCAKNPSDTICNPAVQSKNQNFDFTSVFSCTCDKELCIKLEKEDRCVFNYCPGAMYCCDQDLKNPQPSFYFNATKSANPPNYYVTELNAQLICKDDESGCKNETWLLLLPSTLSQCPTDKSEYKSYDKDTYTIKYEGQDQVYLCLYVEDNAGNSNIAKSRLIKLGNNYCSSKNCETPNENGCICGSGFANRLTSEKQLYCCEPSIGSYIADSQSKCHEYCKSSSITT